TFVSYEERRDWNLWHPDDFRVDYQFMLDKLVNILENNPHDKDYKVFIGTVPLVTIIPLLKRTGRKHTLKVQEWCVTKSNPSREEDLLDAPHDIEYIYSDYYTYYPFADTFDPNNDQHVSLSLQDVLYIDNCIRQYNRIIQELVMEANKKLKEQPNGKARLYIVDTASHLNNIAIKRQGRDPYYRYPKYVRNAYPPISTHYYDVSKQGQIKAGGFFSLDGVHPTAIGHGIIAYDFLKVMKEAGVERVNPENIDWKEVYDSDSLYRKPIVLLNELRESVEFAKLILKIGSMNFFSDDRDEILS
ncbi:MAG: SGNH/GDSL hydrolase family protein, partial [Cytophagales bacterium]|nr:SGNH/GDSL hydrolase family protein [Cytophagales bacterium]